MRASWALFPLVPVSPAMAQDMAEPLRFTVGPSRTEEAETLDQKLARRERGFRFICIGCVRGGGQAPGGAPFEPIRTLNAPGLSRAMADPVSDPPPDNPAPEPDQPSGLAPDRSGGAPLPER